MSHPSQTVSPTSYHPAMPDPRITRVDDPSDPRLDDFIRLKDLNLRKKLETERGLYLAEGAVVIGRALDAGHTPRAMLVSESRLPDCRGLPIGDAPLYVAPDALMERITGYDVHRGAIVSMHRPPLPDLAAVIDGARRIVILEDLTGHTNVGAIIRSVAALGADAVLVTPHCADPLYRRAIRVSMGTVFQVPWTRITPWPQGVRVLREAGFTVVALEPSDDSVPIDDFAADLPDRIALILGTEGDGLGQTTRDLADVRVRIPMAAGVSSLNVASAAALALWELRPR